MSALHTGATVLVALLILRTGFVNTVLVIAGVALALCHPLVRTFLELPDAQETPEPKLAEAPTVPPPVLRSHTTSPRRSLTSLPPALRPKAKQIISYITRDFVQYWYNPISFCDMSFPDTCAAAMEHASGTLSDAFSHYTHDEVATQLLITGCNAVATALRQRKRSLQTGKPVLGLWTDDSARIETLRLATGALLQRILPSDDCASPALHSLLTEVITRQTWEVLISHSDPNVINSLIVTYGNRGIGSVAAAVTLSLPGVEMINAESKQAEPEAGESPSPIEAPKEAEPPKPAESPKSVGQLEPIDTAQPKNAQEKAPSKQSPTISQARALFTEPFSSVAESWKSNPTKEPQPPRTTDVAQVLADRTSDAYAGFESYLQSGPDGHVEGLVLLQLYANLEAVCDSCSDSEPEIFASDSSAVLQTAAFMLEDVPESKVHMAISDALKRPLRAKKDLAPVRSVLLERIQQLYDEYTQSTGALSYTPRRQNTDTSPKVGATAALRCASVIDVSGGADKGGPVDLRTFEMLISIEDANATDGCSGYVVIRRWPQLEGLHAELTRIYSQRPDDSVLQHPPPRLPSIRGKTSAEACAAVEDYLCGLLAPPPGDKAGELYATTQPVRSFIDKTRADEPAALAQRANLMSSIGGVGRTFASGVVGAADTARKGLGQIAAPTPRWNAANMTYVPRNREKPKAQDELKAPPVPPRTQSAQSTRSTQSAQSDTGEDAQKKATTDLPVPGASSAEPADAAPPPPPRRENKMSAPKQAQKAAITDTLVRAVFGVAYEAFDLQGAWTMRRGLLRVLEQIVRTTYASAAASSVSYMSSALSEEALVTWLDVLSDSLWPGGVWNSESAPEPTAEERTSNAAKAKETVLKYTPTQAALALGIGGKQLCIDALSSVHEVVTDPVVARDLQLSILLRVMDMGTAAST